MILVIFTRISSAFLQSMVMYATTQSEFENLDSEL